MKKCPKCKIQHLDGVDLCDCGYRFSTDTVEKNERTTHRRSDHRTNKFLAAAGVLVLALIAGSYFGRMVGTEAATLSNAVDQSTRTSPPTTESKIVQYVDSINARTPEMIDSVTRLDKAIAGPGKNLTYLYTFPSHSRIDFEAGMINTMQNEIREHACGSSTLVELLKQGATATYIYRAKDGVNVVKKDVRESDCT